MRAEHLIGGELFYDCLGGGNFKITLRLYRDCRFPPGISLAPFDDPVSISVFKTIGGVHLFTINIPLPASDTIDPQVLNPCYSPPISSSGSVCIEQAIYVDDFFLPYYPGGLTLSYQRCCRPGSIVNIPTPSNVGGTYVAEIPDIAWSVCNSSPRYNAIPPFISCFNNTTSFIADATDPDGDQLVYSICSPFDGASSTVPMPAIASSPPYSPVVFSAPLYTASAPIQSSPPMTINASTGLIDFNPQSLGMHVMAYCVSEYRSGVLLSTNKRDFQMMVVAGNCPPHDMLLFAEDSLGVDSVYSLSSCSGFNFDFDADFFTASDSAAVSVSQISWNFPDLGVSILANGEATLNYIFPDTGTYLVVATINSNTNCPASDSVTVRIFEPVKLDIAADSAQCIINNGFNFQALGNFNRDSTFHWFFANNSTTPDSFIKNPQNISWSSTGMHIVSLVMKDAYCRDSTSDTIYVDPELDIGFISNFTTICTNTPGDFEIDEAASAYSNDASFIWDFGDGDSSFVKQTTHLFDVPGNYTVDLTVNNPTGCPDTITFPFPVLITVNPSPTAELLSDTTTATMFNPVIQFSDLSVGALLTDFDPGDGNSFNSGAITYTYGSAGDYWAVLTVENTFGCKDADSLKIFIEPYFSLFIPNAFSPDGDGINDFFGPVGGGINQFLFRVYDRWGHLIFESDSIDKLWDGTVNGGKTIAKQDIYTYTLDIVDFQRQQSNYKGRITLLR